MMGYQVLREALSANEHERARAATDKGERLRVTRRRRTRGECWQGVGNENDEDRYVPPFSIHHYR